jgi:hypothetical protein
VLALKQVVNILTGGVGDGSNAAVTPAALATTNAAVAALAATVAANAIPLPVAVASGGTGNAGGAWTTFTPTITAQSGAFTTASAAGSFQQIGKLVSFICTITITTVGTAAGNILMPMPAGTLKRAFATEGVETALTGKGVNVFGAAGASALNLNQSNASGASLIAAGNVITISGTYEAT